jgi:cytochrome P450
VTLEFDPLAPEQRENPFPVYEALRRERPVSYAPAYDMWVVTRYADVLAVLKDHDTYSSAGALKSSPAPFPPEVRAVLDEGHPEMPLIIEIDPPLHDSIRRLVTKAFTPRRIAGMEPHIAAIADELLEELAPAGRADIIERFAWPLPLRVMGRLLGIPREDLHQVHEWGLDWLMLQQEGPVEQRVGHARGFVELQRYFVRAIEQRRRRPADDLMGALAEAMADADPPLTVADVAGVPLDLVVAGHVTVTRAIGSIVTLMFRHPEIRDHLLTPDLAGKAIEEMLRLESPAQGLFRRTTRDVELGGVRLPEGARLMVHFGSANRDEHVFREPAEYEPERGDLGRNISFGKGIHFCIGAPLGRLELGTALPMLLRRLPNLRPAPDVTPEPEPVFFARGFRRLVVEWDPSA